MPAPGQLGRSRNGCFRCRTRKIKCDEGRPECGRCKSAGHSCPGYKSPNDVVFRSMNKSVENKVVWSQKQERIREGNAPIRKLNHNSRISSSSSSEDGRNTDEIEIQYQPVYQTAPVTVFKREETPLCWPMPTDWRDPALCRFFSDYVLEAGEVAISPGYLNHLPKIYGEATDEILTHAVSAVSLASFSNQVRSVDLLITARKSYGKALILLKRALSSPTQVKSDGTLAGVFFCNMYEMISGDTPMINHWGTHADALSMLLELRGTSEQFTDARAGGISRAAHGVVLFKNLVRRQAPGKEASLWAESAPADAHWAQVGLASIRIARVLPLADGLLAEDPNLDPTGERLLHLIAILQAEDGRFETWTETIFDGNLYPYVYGTIDQETLLAQGKNISGIPLPDKISFYEDIWVSGFWNIYRFARVVLIQTLAKLADRVALYPHLRTRLPEMEMLKAKIFKDIDKMVDDVCASIPFVLGKVDANGWTPQNQVKAIAGYTSIWPLRLALMVKTLSTEQKRYIFKQLEYIQGSMGIRQAVPAQGR